MGGRLAVLRGLLQGKKTYLLGAASLLAGAASWWFGLGSDQVSLLLVLNGLAHISLRAATAQNARAVLAATEVLKQVAEHKPIDPAIMAELAPAVGVAGETADFVEEVVAELEKRRKLAMVSGGGSH